MINLVVWAIIVVKVLFIGSTLTDAFLTHVLGLDTTWLKQVDAKLRDVREWSQTLFIVGMSALLVYRFRPGWWDGNAKNKLSILVTKEEKMLFYLFGLILIIDALAGTLVDYIERK